MRLALPACSGVCVPQCVTPSAFSLDNTFLDMKCWVFQGRPTDFPNHETECNESTSSFKKDVLDILVSKACCDGEMKSTCPAKPACFQAFLQCYLDYHKQAGKELAQDALLRNGVTAGISNDEGEEKSGDCFQAIGYKAGGAEGCCGPVEHAIDCMTSRMGDGWANCPGLVGEPFDASEALLMRLHGAFQSGGYCTVKPWAMAKGDKVAYFENELKAAREKKAEASCDEACLKEADDAIASLQASLNEAEAEPSTTTPVDPSTNTTTLSADGQVPSAASVVGPVSWHIIVTAAGLVAAVF